MAQAELLHSDPAFDVAACEADQRRRKTAPTPTTANTVLLHTADTQLSADLVITTQPMIWICCVHLSSHFRHY